MHIPDGFLDPKTWVTLDVISAGGIGYAVKKIGQYLEDKSIPLMGVMAAFIFAVQMLNFPVAGGTSGHFMGGVLAAILLGPLTGLIIMSAVLVVQCFVFQDGGLTVLGANIFNMGLIGAVAGYYIYLFIHKLLGKNNNNLLISAFFSSWLAIILAASVCSLELAFSGTVPLHITLPAMAGVHALIGIGEGIITTLVLSFILKVRPDLLKIKKI